MDPVFQKKRYHTFRIRKTLPVPYPCAAVLRCLPRIQVNHIYGNLFFFCPLYYLYHFLLILVDTFGHPQPKGPLGYHGYAAGHVYIIRQEILIIPVDKQDIIQGTVIHLHAVGNIGAAPHVKGHSGIAVHQNGIPSAAHKIGMVLIGILRVGAQGIFLPAVDFLPSFIEFGELFPEAVKGLIGIHVHALPDTDHLSFFVTVKADGKILAHIVHIGVSDLFLRKQSAVQIGTYLPG